MPTMLVEGLVFPEGPRWYGEKLWFSDMHAHRVLTVDLDGRLEIAAEFDDKPSGLGFLPDGTPLAVLMRKHHIVTFKAGKISLHADLSAWPGHHLNDMVVDGLGRAYVGKRANKPPDTVVLVTPDGRFRTVAEDMWGPNGSAITPDGQTLIVAESRVDRLTAFSIQQDGSLTDRRVFAQLDALPDGICLDAEGAVWVGLAYKGEFVRVLQGGEVLERTPKLSNGRWAVACALGGPDRRTLFMLTATETLENITRMVDFDADLTSASTGFIETMEVRVGGVGWP